MLAAGSASARNDILQMKIADAMARPDAVSMLNKDIRFYFGDAAHPAVERSLGVFPSNQKANGFGHADSSACDRAFLSALLSLQKRAVQEGGNAVIKITSYYKRNIYSSATEFQCGAGAIVVGVALRGEVVKLRN
ncbi:MAG: excinuclease [Gammaproteobacteria bacterium]|nr:excinuclease [Gammaproteobacteria bacterium]